MIEFHLDTRSGVSAYQQLVQQVRRALRLGLLSVGDQLPTVKDVVGQLAINPNTVLKAYRELEHAGLVAARPGLGTFVTATLGEPRGRARPVASGSAALAGQGTPGRPGRREHRGPVPGHLSWTELGRRGMSAVLAADGLGKRYRRTMGAAGLYGAGAGRTGGRPGRPERRRQDDAAAPRRSG